jgi:hypothetical protein
MGTLEESSSPTISDGSIHINDDRVMSSLTVDIPYQKDLQ